MSRCRVASGSLLVIRTGHTLQRWCWVQPGLPMRRKATRCSSRPLRTTPSSQSTMPVPATAAQPVAACDSVNADVLHPSEIVEFTTHGHFVREYNVDSAQGGAFGLDTAAHGPFNYA